MKDILLISEQFVKNTTNISDNINGKLLLPAIREAQEIGLREILGDALLDKIKNMVDNNTLDTPANVMYKNVVLQAQYYLAYDVIANVCMLTAVKIDNAGLQQISDEKMNPISIDDSYNISNFYRKKADFYCKRLQNFLINNQSELPELTQNHLHSIKSHLNSAANTGLWLGGVRGPKRKRGSYLQNKYDK